MRFRNSVKFLAQGCLILTWASILIVASHAQTATGCLTDAEAKKVIASLDAPTVPPDIKKIRKELVQMADEQAKIDAKISSDVQKNQALIPQSSQMEERHLVRVCEILKTTGWLTREALEDDAFNALVSLIGGNRAFALQRELLPVLVEAVRKGQLSKSILASLVDGLRVASGLPQIFGTQARIRDEAVYLYPLLDDQKVDEWRREYELPTLDAQIASMEGRYLRTVVKTPRRRTARSDQKQSGDETTVLGIDDSDPETVKVQTNIVSLNVRVESTAPAAATLALTKDDFSVLEDGVEETISSFATIDKPFDLVLLLDFSGSTSDKRNLIKKAAQRFVASARTDDRIAVVAFATKPEIICNFTNAKSELNDKIGNIDMNGSSPIWASLQFTYDNIFKNESVGRRSAIVFMTDGEDNSQNIRFADVLETVRHGDTTIFSVWVNTGFGWGNEMGEKRYRQRLQTPLEMLADETGGAVYKVGDLKDLNGVYDQVINDLGRVYSIGYEPKNDAHEGGWRDITVKIKNHPDLIAKTRRGYYAN